MSGCRIQSHSTARLGLSRRRRRRTRHSTLADRARARSRTGHQPLPVGGHRCRRGTRSQTFSGFEVLQSKTDILSGSPALNPIHHAPIISGRDGHRAHTATRLALHYRIDQHVVSILPAPPLHRYPLFTIPIDHTASICIHGTLPLYIHIYYQDFTFSSHPAH